MRERQNLTGIWEADLERSTLLGPAPRGLTAKIRHDGLNLAVAMLITMPDGTQQTLAFRGPTDGTEITNKVGAREWRSRIRWLGEELVIESRVEVEGRELHLRDYWLLSEDGRSLTMAHRDDDLRGQITVLERASAP